MSKRYRRLQIVKHALNHYLLREAPEEEKAQERAVLKKIEDEIELFKYKNRMK